MPKSSTDRSDVLSEVAFDTLSALERIADAAAQLLGQRPTGVDAFAAVNELTAARAVENFGRVQADLASAYRRLREEPAIARLVVADENNKQEVLYVCRATPVQCDVPLCSSLGPKGRLASLPVGGDAAIRLPSGVMHYEVIEKAILRPICPAGTWDARNTVFHAAGIGPLTIASLRDLLAQAGFSEDDLDVLERQLAEEDEATNIVEGLKHSVLTAMQLRDQPILDQFQDDIFRLPLDSRLIVLGPPGTGKTTTLVRRLRQKVDFEFLGEEEASLVEAAAEAGLPHAQSWMMFTPTELLKQYVREAFAREGVPAPEQRIRTWSDHRRDLARRSLPVLRSATGGTLVLNEHENALPQSTITGQIEWFEDFDSHQSASFLDQLAVDAQTLQQAQDLAVARVGARLATLLDGAYDRPITALSAVAGLFEELRRIIGDLSGRIQDQLRRPLAQHVRQDGGLLDDLGRFVSTLSADAEDDPEDADADDDEAATPPQGRKAAQAAFIRALRAQAVAEARKRPVPKTSRAGRVLQWLRDRGVNLPDFAAIGEEVVIQRAARKIVSSPTSFVRGVPTRYRAFRRERKLEGRWYLTPGVTGNEITPLEVDVVLLAMLRNARAMLDDSSFMRRLGDRIPQLLTDVTRLQRNQILVDEAPDFSPVQLACMAALASSWTNSFFACGDFNQRLTVWGSRSADHLKWIYPDIKIREIDVAYRQSRRLNELAGLLLSTGGEGGRTRLPEHLNNEGVAPVFGAELSDLRDLVAWLAARIAEIENFTGQLPSIAVLVNESDMLHPLAEGLNAALASENIRAVACPDGQVMGQENDVRVFEVEHIKGLEFEAVFFIDVDELEQRQPELFGKYIYVGATRAATYLGMTCSESVIPKSLQHVRHLFAERW